MLLYSVILCALYSFACLCLGAILLKTLSVRSTVVQKISPISWVATSFLLGSAVMANVWCVLLSLALFNRMVIGEIVVLCIMSGFVFVWQFRVSFIEQLKQIWKDFVAESLPWKIVFVLTLIIAGERGLACLFPLHPSGDAAAFYMVLPKLLAGSQRLSSLGGYEHFMTIGLHGEFHFSALMSLGCGSGAKLFTWPISLACALILAALASRAGVGRRGQWLVISMVFSSSAFTLLIGDGKVDIFAAAMGVAAFFWALQKRSEPNGATQLLAGLFAGFAIIAKISYLPLIITCIILLIMYQHFTTVGWAVCRRSNLKNLGTKFFWLALGISLPVIVHLLKNWVLFHEPFAPFLYLNEDPFSGNWANQTWFSPKIIKKIILTYPLALTYGRYPMQYGTMSVMVLAFTPLVLLLPKAKRLMQSVMLQITVLGLIGIVIWILIRPGVFAPRYFLYTLLLLIPFAAGCAEYISKNETKPRWLAGALVVLCIISLSVFYLQNYKRGLVNYLIGYTSDSKICAPVYQASERLNNIAEPGARVYSLTYFTFWFRPDLLQCMSTIWEKGFLINQENIKAYEAWSYIHDRGFQYVFLDQTIYSSTAEILSVQETPEWLEVRVIFNQENNKIYQLTSKDAKRRPKVVTKEIRPSVWKIVDIAEG